MRYSSGLSVSDEDHGEIDSGFIARGSCHCNAVWRRAKRHIRSGRSASIVPFPPGGGTDLVSRTIQPALQARLGQQVVIDNRGGAQGLRRHGDRRAGRARRLHAGHRGDRRDRARARHQRQGAVRPGQGLRADHQADRAALHHVGASVGAGEDPRRVHQAREGESGRAQLRLRQHHGARRAGSCSTRPPASSCSTYPYRGLGPVGRPRWCGNEVQALFSGPGAAMPQIKAGRIRGLAVSTIKRSRELPDLPTLDESGFKGFEISGWYGLAAPARTPQPVIARLNNELVEDTDRRRGRAAPEQARLRPGADDAGGSSASTSSRKSSAGRRRSSSSASSRWSDTRAKSFPAARPVSTAALSTRPSQPDSRAGAGARRGGSPRTAPLRTATRSRSCRGPVTRSARLQNVLDSGGTAILHSGKLEGGTRLTAEHCARHGKPRGASIDASESAARRTLRAARASKWPGARLCIER